LTFININWYGPYGLHDLKQLNDTSKDFGIYQVCGSHPVYGSNVLLYIGKAVQQTFATRIAQENWHYNKDSGNVQIYVGRLGGNKKIPMEKWEQQIHFAEKLLIYSHAPACNSQNIGTVPFSDLANIHILNWGNYRDLLPEVSSKRWASDHEAVVEYSM
jgi:hypothetical protein